MGCQVPHFMIVVIPYINLINLSWIIKCLFLRNMEPLMILMRYFFSDIFFHKAYGFVTHFHFHKAYSFVTNFHFHKHMIMLLIFIFIKHIVLLLIFIFIKHMVLLLIWIISTLLRQFKWVENSRHLVEAIKITLFNLITTHTPISAQSSDYSQCTLLLLYKDIRCGYPFELRRLIDAIQMSTHNICFYEENQRKSHKHHQISPLLIFFKVYP